MDRRRFLALLPAVLGGCAGVGTDAEPSERTASPTATPSLGPPVTEATRTEATSREFYLPRVESDAAPFANYVVGNSSSRPADIEPHYVVVENQADRSQTITVRVSDQAADSPALDAELSFP